jgi:hypothetical protein
MMFVKKTRFFAALLLTAWGFSPVMAAPLPGLEAGRAENPGADYTPNAQGVYPVRLRWQNAASSSTGCHVYRSEGPASDFVKISAEPVQADSENAGFFTFVDENPAAVPGKIYYYRVLFLDAQGTGSHFSEICMGYGALSHEQYLLEYDKTVKSSHKKLTYMHRKAAISKLGSETKNGTLGGSIAYRARIAGLGARVTIRYENYADFFIEDGQGLYFLLTGDCNTTASMDQSGTMDGTMIITGMYPGKIFYDRIVIKKAAAADGTYGVEPAGFPRREINWKLVNP